MKKPGQPKSPHDYFVSYPDGSRTPFMSKAHARTMAPNFRGTVHHRDGADPQRTDESGRSAKGAFSPARLLQAVSSLFTRFRRGE